MIGHWLVVFAMLFATSVWVGGFVAIAVVTRVARRQLTPADQVAFFRDLGRSFGIVGATALVVALACGTAMASDREWSGTTLAAAIIATALTIATASGVAQARRMTRLRARAVQHPDDDALADRVRRGAARALALRGAIGALTLALLLVGALLASE